MSKVKELTSKIAKYGNNFQDKEKRKKLIIIIVAGIIIFLFMTITSKKEKKVEKQKTSIRTQEQVMKQKKEDASRAQAIVIPGSRVSNQDIWMQEGQKKLSEVKQTSDQTVKNVQEISTNQIGQTQKIEDLNKRLDTMITTISTQQQIIATMKGNTSGTVKNRIIDNPSQIQEIDMENSDSEDNGSTNSQATINKLAGQNQNPGQNTNTTMNKSNSSEKDRIKDYSEYIPSNSFVQGNLIEGISANTGGNANSDPTPVLIRLTNLAQLPNFFRANVKNCMVGGSGFGDLSTERVKIRLDKLSCVLKNGNVIDVPVKGHVAGEDGKAGIRGVVVSHAGSALAKAALTGSMASLGSAAQVSTQTQMVSPIGVTNTINPNQAFGSAAAGGAAGGFNTLAAYYTKLLDQITPSIEVSSGRNVTVVFQEGITLKQKLTDTISETTALPFNSLNQ